MYDALSGAALLRTDRRARLELNQGSGYLEDNRLAVRTCAMVLFDSKVK
jgi:hypothetical protein